jgi:predicted transcriptional regulator
MSTAELKSQLHKLIVETDDVNALTKIRAFINKLKKNDGDWWDEIDDSTKEEIQVGIDQADNGDFIEHAEATKRLDEFFKKHG